MTDWREVYEALDPTQNLITEWQRLVPDVAYPTFRKMIGAQGGKRGKKRALGVFTETEDGAMVSSSSTRITTIEALLAVCKVDVRLWQVERVEITGREVQRKDIIRDLRFDEGKVTGTLSDSGGLVVEPLINIRAWLKRKVEAPLDLAVDRIVDRLRQNAPTYRIPKALRPTGEYLLVPSLYDAHFGKRSADGRYTVPQAAETFRLAGEALIARVTALPYPLARVLLPAGQDGLHADSLSGQTTKGTWVEMSADLRDAIDALIVCYTDLVEKLATLAPVDVFTIQSNHDRMGTHWLGKVLQAQFSKHANVNVTVSRSPRVYYRFGSNLFGIEHGDKSRPSNLALLMATEAPQLWAETRHREWMQGHLHKERGMYHAISEEMGVRVRTIPALCPVDEYHLLHGFVGSNRAAEGALYHYEHGSAGVFPVFVTELESAAPVRALAA